MNVTDTRKTMSNPSHHPPCPRVRRQSPSSLSSSKTENDKNHCPPSKGRDLSDDLQIQSCHARVSTTTHSLAIKSIQKQQEQVTEHRVCALSQLQQHQEKLPLSSNARCQSQPAQKSLKDFLTGDRNGDVKHFSNDSEDDDDSTCNNLFDVFRWSNATAPNNTNSSSTSSSSSTISTKATASASTIVACNGVHERLSTKSRKQQRDAGTRKLMTSQEYFLKRQSKCSHSRVIESVLALPQLPSRSNSKDVSTSSRVKPNSPAAA